MICEVEGCWKTAKGKGLCMTHYMRQRRNKERRRQTAASANSPALSRGQSGALARYRKEFQSKNGSPLDCPLPFLSREPTARSRWAAAITTDLLQHEYSRR